MTTSTFVVRRVRPSLRLLPCLLLGGLGCAGADGAFPADHTAVVRADVAADDAQDHDVHPPPEYPWDDEECDDVYELRASSGVDRSKPYLVQPEVPVSPQFIFDAPWGDKRVKPLAFHPLIDNDSVIKHWYLREASDGTQLAGWQHERAFSPTPRDDRDELPRGPHSLRLDVRYQNKASAPVADRSGVAICVVDLEDPGAGSGGCGTCF